MDKALIEKAFCNQRGNMKPECKSNVCEQCKVAWNKGATWQREQLIQTIKDNSEYDPNKERFYITSNLIYELSLGNFPESKKYETKELYGENNLSEREQLEDKAAEAIGRVKELEAEKNKLIKDIEVCRKATNGTDDYSVGMRNGMEVILCTLEKREPRMDNCLPRTNNLSEREQLISELKEWACNNIKVPFEGSRVVEFSSLLAKLDLLEKGGDVK